METVVAMIDICKDMHL